MMAESAVTFSPQYASIATSIVDHERIANMTARTRPIEKFAKATAQCSAEVLYSHQCSCDMLTRLQAAAYGQCIFADYTAVHKDMCVKEFMRLKDCYLVWVLFLF